MMIAGYGGLLPGDGDVRLPRYPGDVPLGDPKRRLPRPVDPNDPSGGRGTMPPPELPFGGGPIAPPKPGTLPFGGGPIAPPRPGNMGPVAPPGAGRMPPRSGGFDPRAFAGRLNPQQQADFAALRRNTGGNFQNLGGEAGLMKRYGVKQGPKRPGNPAIDALQNFKY